MATNRLAAVRRANAEEARTWSYHERETVRLLRLIATLCGWLVGITAVSILMLAVILDAVLTALR